MKNKLPFFVVGCGRSGTSLLRTMLNHHPSLSIPLESLFMIDYLKASQKISLTTLKKLIINEPEIKEWGIKIKKKDIRKCSSTKDLVTKVNYVYMKKRKKKIWGQKTPRFIRHWKLLKKHYPDSKFIFLVRDPRGTVNSLVKSNVHFSNAYFAAKRWKMDMLYGLDLLKKYPKDTLVIKFENLIISPEKELKRVCKILKVTYHPKMMKYSKTGKNEYLPYFQNIHQKLSKRPDKSVIDKWKVELSKREIELVEYTNKNLMKKLGFKLVSKNPKKNRFYIYLLYIQRCYGFTRQILNYLAKRRNYFVYSIYRKMRLGTIYKDVKSINY